MMRKRNNRKRNVQFFAAAALSAALLAGQIQPASVHGDSTQIQVSSLIPDNVTIDQPVPLSEISLPGSDYGTLSWVNSSSVPSERVQSYDVVFRPYNSADLAKISGWDGVSDAIYGTVTVVVNGLDNESQENEEEWSEEESQDDSGSNGEWMETETDEETKEPDAEAIPGAEEKPEPTVTPAGTEEEGTEEEGTEEDKAETETGEETEEADAEVTPGGEEAPEPTVTPAETEESDTEEVPGVTVTPEATVTATPTPTVTPEDIFDREEEETDDRPVQVEEEEEFTEEETAAMAEANHSCNGIYVSGINLPWYVQFRATSGEDYEFTNENEANIFKSYEFELWDLKNNTEYEIPDGEYISVTVPVKEGYEYTIEHLLDNGAMETIVPSVNGSTMVFSTHSFSPFGIAGSKPLVGEEIATDGYETTPAATATPAPSSSDGDNGNSASSGTVTPSASSGNSAGSTDSRNTDGSSQDSANENTDSSGESTDAVNTGDTTPIAPFVVLAVAAVVIIVVIIYLRKRKK